MKNSCSITSLAACGLLVACAAMPAPPPPTGAGLAHDGSAVRVVLLWNEPVDLDLYVTDPTQESVYFANKKASSGGILEKDAVCGGGAGKSPRSESVRWSAAPPGRYRVSLDFIDRCGEDVREVGYRLLVDASGSRQERTGTIRLAQFVYQAFEFDVGESPREESRSR